MLAHRARGAAAVRGHVRARALPVRGRRRGDRRARSWCWKTAPAASAPIDMPMDVLLGKPPKMHRDVQRVARSEPPLDLTGVTLEAGRASTCCATRRWRRKRFLITIGDRTVGGLSHRDQMVGPWQVPVADCAVTLADYAGFRGEAMSMGERTPLAALDAPASGRMAVGEAITNLLAAPIELPRVKLSCQLDGRLRRARRRRRAVRHRARPWAWSCARRWASASRWARIQPVDAHALDRRAAPTQAGHRAGVPDRHRLRHAGRRARHADAAAAARRHHADPDRPGPGPQPHGRLDAGAGAGPVRRRRCPTWTTRSCSRPGRRHQRAARRRASCWPTTTAATAACGPRCARWPLPATLGVSLNVDLLVTEGDGIADSRAEYGDSKNWAAQVERAPRRADARRRCSTKSSAWCCRCRTAERDAVMATLRAHGLSRTATSSARPNDQRRGRGLARRQGGVQRAAARPAPGLGRGELAHRARSATTRPAPTPSTPRPAPPATPACTCT